MVSGTVPALPHTGNDCGFAGNTRPAVFLQGRNDLKESIDNSLDRDSSDDSNRDDLRVGVRAIKVTGALLRKRRAYRDDWRIESFRGRDCHGDHAVWIIVWRRTCHGGRCSDRSPSHVDVGQVLRKNAGLVSP